ncbi:MAG: Trifunctional nucleotide phosphoesterase protein YfkN [Flavobacteriales bacterium]|nr:MAG: Trifunctional nucleotide phosphoesterase protein YfkN [Flavobacteriales bacterium]
MNRRKFIYNSSLASLSVIGLESCDLISNDVKISILHTNDLHSQIEAFPANHDKFPDRGGFARRGEIFKSLIKTNPNTLIFDAGDIFQGTPYFNFFQGELELSLMKKMGYNAATIGNHEFDAGLEMFRKNILNNNFQFISSNYDFTNTDLNGITSIYKIYNRQGIKIGVFGLGIELKGLVNPFLYKETKYYDPIEISQEMINILKKREKCDLIICISHLGHNYKTDKICDTKLAKMTSDIDLIIGGHTHTLLKKPLVIKNSINNDVIINQVGQSGVYIGKIDFIFSNNYKTSDNSLVEV